MSVSSAATVRAQLASTLAAAANPTGGWGYAPGLASRIEPTCWALLGLRGAAVGVDRYSGHIEWLRSLQRADGLLAHAGQPPNVAFNGLTALVLHDTPPTSDQRARTSDTAVHRLVEGIVKSRGVSRRENPVTGHDDTLRGWPWVPETHSWVEPTAWCLLAISRSRRAMKDSGSERLIGEARRLLIDRACGVGGWNYGNPSILGRALPPFVAPTALALLALQDQAIHQVVGRAVSYLRATWPDEPSGMALALVSLAFEILGQPHDDVDAQLGARLVRPGLLGRLADTGMALYALTAENHHAAAFRL